MPHEEPHGAVDLEPGRVLVAGRVGVQRLLRRGEGVEQGEPGLARDVLVVPLEHELDRYGDLPRRRGQRIVPEEPKTAAVIRGSTAVSGTPIAVPLLALLIWYVRRLMRAA
jgi:hypothetical protein